MLLSLVYFVKVMKLLKVLQNGVQCKGTIFVILKQGGGGGGGGGVVRFKSKLLEIKKIF